MATEKSEPTNPTSLELFVKYDEELSQECQNLITTLPTEMDWFSIQLYQYQGFWYQKRLIQGILNGQNHFQAHDSDILIVTPPKCGTTWLKALTFSIFNRKIHDPNPTQMSSTHPLLSANPHDLAPNFEFRLYFNRNDPDLSAFSSPMLFSSHLPYISLPNSVKQSRCKIVYLCRDPKDVFVSLWHFMNRLRPEVQEFNTIDYLFDKFCRGVNYLGGSFWDHMLGYYQKSLEMPENIMFLKYEELKSEPVRVVKDLGKYLGCGFSEEEEKGNVIDDILRFCSFEHLRNLEVNKSGKLPSGVEHKFYFRCGEVGDWKNFFTVGKHGLKF